MKDLIKIFLIFLFHLNILISQSGSGILKLIQPATPCGCSNASGCGCNAGTGNCATQTISITLTIPPNTDATLNVGQNLCSACGSGSDWETGEGVIVSTFGISYFGGSGGICPPLGVNSGCRSTGSSGTTVTISFTANRMDEQATYNMNFTNNNGTLQCNSLPVSFLNFRISKAFQTNKLSFSTASETNNDYFTIERSADGQDFSVIGMKDGAGNSNSEINYEFTDEKPLEGINFYRIKQTDFDGQYSYSDIRSVRFRNLGGIQVSPRTTEGRLNITTDLNDYVITIINAAGQTIRRFVSMSMDQAISIEDLHSGLYFVRVSSGSESETIKVIKI